MLKQFLTLKYDYLQIKSESLEEYLNNHTEQHLKNFFRCALLNNLYWGIWAVLLIKEKDINNDVFNFGYVSTRMDLYEYTVNHPEFSKYLS